MPLHVDHTYYPCGSDERPILDAYRTSIQTALGKAGCVMRIDGLSVSTIRAIVRDRTHVPGYSAPGMEVPDPKFAPVVAAFQAAEAEYQRAGAELADTVHRKPGARPVHT